MRQETSWARSRTRYSVALLTEYRSAAAPGGMPPRHYRPGARSSALNTDPDTDRGTDPSLLVAGPLSDAVGRRSVLLPAVALAALGSLVFALAAASGPLTAALTELEPTGDRRKAALVSTVASVGGLGLGPVLAGLLAQ